MDGILLLAHGSRAPESVRTMESIAEQTRQLLPEHLIQVAFMQFNDVNIEKGLLMLMDQGATRVKIVPYFLFDGVHIKEDIPQEVAEFKQAHPQIEITLGQTLGTDARLAQIVAERIRG